MQKAPVLKASGLAPVEDEPVHVFGRNLEQRVVDSRGDDNKEEGDRNERDQESAHDDDVESIKKVKFDAITGEEDEETVFQGDFKLFSWCLDTSNWIEKGRGQLKLNDSADSDEKRSRLIMRTGGTYRIVLNVAIKRSFFKVISNTKTNIRFTNSETVWAASGSNAGQLADLIRERLAQDAETTPVPTKELASDVTTSPKSEPASDESKSPNKEPTSDETKSPNKAPASDEIKSPEKDSESSSEENETPASEKAVSDTDDSSKSPVTSVATGSANRRHSGASDDLEEGESGTKKLKKSSD